MIHYVTECKTDKTLIEKIEWTSGRVTEIEKKYEIGSRCMHRTKKEAFNFIKLMNDKGVSYVMSGTFGTIKRRKS